MLNWLYNLSDLQAFLIFSAPWFAFFSWLFVANERDYRERERGYRG